MLLSLPSLPNRILHHLCWPPQLKRTAVQAEDNHFTFVETIDDATFKNYAGLFGPGTDTYAVNDLTEADLCESPTMINDDVRCSHRVNKLFLELSAKQCAERCGPAPKTRQKDMHKS